jgi:hypothetical protein
MSVTYEPDQTLEIPTDMKDLIKGFIDMRKNLTITAFADIGKAFGLAPKDIGDNQHWKLILDRDIWKAQLEDVASEKEVDIGTAEPKLFTGTVPISIDEILGPIAKLEAQQALQPLLIKLIHNSFQNLQDYIWRLDTTTMRVLITGYRETLEEEILDEGLKALGVDTDEEVN